VGLGFATVVKRLAVRLTSSFLDAPVALKLLIVSGWLYSTVHHLVTDQGSWTLSLALQLLFTGLWLLRLRWFWWLMAIGSVIVIVTYPLEGRSPWLIAYTVFFLVLVLWPSTYVYVTRRPLPSWVPALPGQSG
jgi:hypothetical protein